MNELVHTAGSFSIIWLGVWCACALTMFIIYPAVRRQLFKWHPAIASRLLLLLLAFPFLLSLSTTIMLFSPTAENTLVSAHCHENCQAHTPLITANWLDLSGLVLLLVILLIALRKILFNLVTAKRLMAQLLLLAQNSGEWMLIGDKKPLVFTLGWWRNRVFITEGLMQECSGKDIDIILLHEFEHVKRLDNLRLLLAKFFLLVLPEKLSQKYYDDLHLLTESACDFAAAERYGELNVAETLLRIQKLVPPEFNLLNSSLASAFTGSEVEWRVRILATGQRQLVNLPYGQTACICLLLAISFVLVDPLHHGIEWMLGLF